MFLFLLFRLLMERSFQGYAIYMSTIAGELVRRIQRCVTFAYLECNGLVNSLLSLGRWVTHPTLASTPSLVLFVFPTLFTVFIFFVDACALSGLSQRRGRECPLPCGWLPCLSPFKTWSLHTRFSHDFLLGWWHQYVWCTQERLAAVYYLLNYSFLPLMWIRINCSHVCMSSRKGYPNLVSMHS